MENQYDVVILGGGLAGLTLSLQLRKEKSDISILILEMRKAEATEAAHKVGESTVELGTHYLREFLDLGEYLDQHQLPKLGLRYFFTPQKKHDIAKRLELGPTYLPHFPSHQLDRGIFENELIERTTKSGTTCILGARVKEVNFGEDEELHHVSYKANKEDFEVSARWVIDATGRGGLLKRKLDLHKDMDHNINSAWFRVKGEVDVDHWSDNQEWINRLEPNFRRLATTHLMDKGYWVWIIPLVSGNTSIGIVADPRFHPFEEFDTHEKAVKWLEKNEPQCAKMLEEQNKDILDFKKLKHYSHDIKKIYSSERWALTGEAGAFLDPFYSPGTDFIALYNTFITDLVCSDLSGDDILLKAQVYNQTHLALIENWIPVYQNKYQLMGSTQIMLVKIVWDWAIYWAVPALLFTNRGYTNLSVLKRVFSAADGAGNKCGTLNKSMQDLFIEWGPHDTKEIKGEFVDIFDVGFLKNLHMLMEDQHEPVDLIKKVDSNMKMLEQIASEIYRLVSHQVNDTALDIPVDPYNMSLEPGKNNPENGLSSNKELMDDLQSIWFYPEKVS